MKRREFVLGAAGMSALAACQSQQQDSNNAQENRQNFSWKMVTTWPPNFPGLGTGANNVAKYIESLSGGRIKIQVYAGGELIPPLEVFDAVSSGTAELGHGGSYYWRSKSEAMQFFTCVPFGLNTHEMNAWLYYGGGLELWQEAYRPFSLEPFPAGNTGVQMGGWFNKEINTMDDFQGLKMRMPGLGGEVVRMAGGTSVALPGSEIFTALQTGVIDATEWVGPYNDLAFGLDKVAKYYYYPGWHEPGPTLECMVNLDAFNSLPEDLKSIIKVACQAVNMDMTAEYNARNADALNQIMEDKSIEVRPYPKEVLSELKSLSRKVINDLANRDPLVAKVWSSYEAFLKKSRYWQQISEQAYIDTTHL